MAPATIARVGIFLRTLLKNFFIGVRTVIDQPIMAIVRYWDKPEIGQGLTPSCEIRVFKME
jgi:hypothetical protein